MNKLAPLSSRYRRIVVDRFGGPEVLRVETLGEVPTPGRGQVRIRVEATSVSATDTVIRKGVYPLLRLTPPFVIGYDVVGHIDALGEGVDNLRVGERIVALPQVGGAADRVCLEASTVEPIADDLDPADAACFALSWITAYQMLHRCAHVARGQVVLVNGASGAVGTALVQLARQAGARVVGTASAAKLAVVRECGGEAVDYASPTLERDLRALSPEGYDAVFDPVGLASFARSFRLTRQGSGRLLTFATQAVARRIDRVTPVAFATFGLHFGLMRILLVLWSWFGGGRSARFYGVIDHHRDHRDWYRADLQRLADLRRQGAIQPVVQRRSLEEAIEAHAQLDRGDVRGQLVLVTGVVEAPSS